MAVRVIEVVMGYGWRDRLRKAVIDAGFNITERWEGPTTCGVVVRTKLPVAEFEEVLRTFLQFDGWMDFNEGEQP